MANITLGQFYNAIREGAREGTLEAQKELFENGQAGVTLYGPNGQPISSSNRIPVEATLTGHLPSLETTHLDGADSNSNGTAATVTGYSVVAFQVSGTFDGLVHFEGTIDGETWFGVEAVSTYGYAGTWVSFPGIFYADVRGLKQIRARYVHVSGAVTVRSVATTGAGSVPKPNSLYRAWTTSGLMTFVNRWWGENGMFGGGSLPETLIPFPTIGVASLVVRIRNRHDVSIRYSVGLNYAAQGVEIRGGVTVVSLQTVNSGAEVELSSATHPELGRPLAGIWISTLRNSSGDIPTSGAVDVQIIGRSNVVESAS